MTNGRRRILVIDDEADVRNVLVEIFEPEHFHLDQAANGREALAQLEKNPDAHLILCDISMPSMSGLEFLAELKARGLGHIPVVMLTAHSETKRLQEALRLGAFDYIVKPFALSQLREVVYKGLEIGVKQAAIKDHLAQKNVDPEYIKKNHRTIELLTLKNNRKRAAGE